MAIATYSDLVTAVGTWIDDTTIAANVPTMIALAEAEFNRMLSVPEQDATATVDTVAATEAVTLSASVQALRAFYYTANGGYVELQAMSLPQMRSMYSWQASGSPVAYALVGATALLAPIPDGVYTLSYVYTSSIPALTVSNTTNWLMTAHPDAYLFGTLLQAEFFGWNDTRLGLIKQRLDDIIAQINKGGNQRRAGSAPIRMQHGVTWG